jgi:hypothetical protein
MKHSEDNNRVVPMNVGNYIGETGENQFARTFNPARSADSRMVRKPFDVPNDLKDRVDCAVGIVAADIFLDRFEIQASCAGPA